MPVVFNSSQCTDPFAVCPGETAPPSPPAEVNYCLENLCRITAPPSPPSPPPPPSPPLPAPPPCNLVDRDCTGVPPTASSAASPAPPPAPSGGLSAVGWLALLGLLIGGWVMSRRYKRGRGSPRALLTGQNTSSSSTMQAPTHRPTCQRVAHRPCLSRTAAPDPEALSILYSSAGPATSYVTTSYVTSRSHEHPCRTCAGSLRCPIRPRDRTHSRCLFGRRATCASFLVWAVRYQWRDSLVCCWPCRRGEGGRLRRCARGGVRRRKEA